MERIKPAARLVNSFGDEICRICTLEHALVFERIMPLCKRHRPGIEPDVDQFGRAFHRTAALLARECHRIDGWFVQVKRLRDVFPFSQLFDAAKALPSAALLTHPNRQRCPPVPVARKRPVLVLFKPIAEPAGAGLGRNPVDLFVQLNHPRRVLCRADVPRLACII